MSNLSTEAHIKEAIFRLGSVFLFLRWLALQSLMKVSNYVKKWTIEEILPYLTTSYMTSTLLICFLLT